MIDMFDKIIKRNVSALIFYCSGGLGKRAWNSGFTGGLGKRAWNSGFRGVQCFIENEI